MNGDDIRFESNGVMKGCEGRYIRIKCSVREIRMLHALPHQQVHIQARPCAKKDHSPAQFSWLLDSHLVEAMCNKGPQPSSWVRCTMTRRANSRIGLCVDRIRERREGRGLRMKRARRHGIGAVRNELTWVVGVVMCLQDP